MRYMGSKRRIVDDILPIMLKGRGAKQFFVEPFCGGCNVTKHVQGRRIAGDINEDLILFYKALQDGWTPPKMINEDEYNRIKKMAPCALRGYAGVTHSFGSKFLSTYRRDSSKTNGAGGVLLKSNYENVTFNGNWNFKAVMDLRPFIANVQFSHSQYYDLYIPPRSIVYCDPPYEGTTRYMVGAFNNRNFWNWCRRLADDGHMVFVSEYAAPDDFKSVWAKGMTTHLNAGHKRAIKKAVEHLWTVK
jgi:DNA adenine methylase